jgi:16S rRNA processing protein RimM
MEYLTIGTIVQPHGLKGELKIYSSTDFSKERYKIGNTVYLLSKIDGQRIPLIVKAHHKVGQFDYVIFKDYEDINLVQDFLKCELQAEKDTIKLPNNTCFIVDLKKCDVYSEQLLKLGKVKDMDQYGSQYNLKVLKENGQIFSVPFVEAFIKKIDIEKKSIIIHVIEGLL